jgi:hypothetical protein
MSLETTSSEDLRSIAAAGGGFRLNAKVRRTEDLRMIAAAANLAAGLSPSSV